MGVIIGGVVGLIWLILIVWAIIKVANSPAGSISKVLWILILLFFPFFGFIAWLLLGPKG